ETRARTGDEDGLSHAGTLYSLGLRSSDASDRGDGNNVRDAGDFVGDAGPAPFHVRSGGCSDPENRAPDLVLAPI
ncbi:MAG TPA: hypothetical protein VF403_03915, partial [Kofleriaceae bacterium]